MSSLGRTQHYALPFVGTVYAVLVLRETRTLEETGVADRILYGVAPIACYVLLFIAMLSLIANPRLGVNAAAGTTALLLLVAICNSWDLTLWALIRSPKH